ncbi:single-stranded DNA-binding protein [Candidatus Falkowbacteria bacterium CG10_big_fil_rev_8_21_14_0_10_39_9]|uniref:Single-stranded DNA-binding protein n=1 Tax=Candidatus Falkowbacteria bacterium CG10_big_fil_rev_8_21_14_0_10_39_9 TaxID=1974566 RepID=A0A2M6WP72_9BACT|nr:MAG: single-stranded DNA-binding protein [Candidatus Falkowbacteria bacterium CG10_big_fil_rev_8_21_14_0_10_39_9]
MSLNKVMLIGNLTKDPEVRTTPSGQNVASFSVATNMNWTDQSGQKQSKAEFHNIVAWRKLADICGQYLHKGSKIYLEGRLQTRDWVGQDGAKKYRTEVVADTMQILSRPGEVGATPTQAENFEAAVGAEGDANSDEEIKIENIPF